jgi:hypothetical protein
VWFDGASPAEQTATSAIWRGPVAGDDGRVALGVTIASKEPEREVPAPPVPTQPVAPEYTRAFLRGVEQRAPLYLSLPLYAARLVLPFIGFVWLVRRRPLSEGASVPVLVAAGVVLGVLRTWPLFRWLAHTIGYAVRDSAIAAISRVAYTSDPDPYVTPGVAFWLTAVLACTLVPSYFRALSQSPPVFARRPSRSWLRRAWRVGRVLVAVGLVTVVCSLMISENPAGRESATRLVRLAGTKLPEFHDEAEAAAALLEDHEAITLIGVAIFALALFACGVRAGLFGLGLLLLALRLMPPDALPGSAPGSRLHTVVASLQAASLPAVSAAAALLAWPLLAWLVSKIVPAAALTRRARWRLALALAAFACLAHVLPAWLLLLLAGFVVIWFVGSVVIDTLAPLPPIAFARDWTRERVGATRLVFLAAALALTLPWTPPNRFLEMGDLSTLLFEVSDATVYVLALVLVVLMVDHMRQDDSVFLPDEWRPVAIYFFAIVLLNSTVSWVFIPVPLLVGLVVGWRWLLRDPTDTALLEEEVIAQGKSAREALQQLLDASRARALYSTVEKTLDRKLEATDLTPDDHAARLKQYRAYLGAEEPAKPAGGFRPHDALFAVGHGTLRKNVRASLGLGWVLALPATAIALYNYVFDTEVSYPYPIAGLVVFLIAVVGSWVLIAFFFGFFFAHLRGTTGLGKGLTMWLALTIPFLALRLLRTDPLTDFQSFLSWTGQVFLFCTLLGLLAFDYGLLRQHGFRARDLVTIHNVPTLSAYASTVIAAVGSAVVTLLSGNVPRMADFFVQFITGKGASGK